MERYIEAHRNIWPELVEVFMDAGYSDIKIFMKGNEVFGFCEGEDICKASNKVSQSPVNSKWQEYMETMSLEVDPNNAWEQVWSLK
jgi:L-rhamnose mutarotase